jgi:hypothetical protein
MLWLRLLGCNLLRVLLVRLLRLLSYDRIRCLLLRDILWLLQGNLLAGCVTGAN